MKIEGPIPSCEVCEILSTGGAIIEVGSGGFSQQVQLETILSSFCRPNQLSLKLEL